MSNHFWPPNVEPYFPMMGRASGHLRKAMRPVVA